MATVGIFKELAKSRGLKDRTIEVLSQEDYDSLDMLKFMEPADLGALDITRGQMLLLRRWLLDLQTEHIGEQSLKEQASREFRTASMLRTQPDGHRIHCIFKELAQSRGLNERTIGKLLKEDYNNLDMLKIMGPADLGALDITRGQRERLRRWLLDLQTEHINSTNTVEVDRPPDPESSTEAPCVADTNSACSAHVANRDRQLNTTATEGTETEPPVVPKMDRVEECIKNLNVGDFFREVITEYFKDFKGVIGLDKVLEAQLMEYMKCKVNIAVVGRPGTGKSSLINSLRNLRARDDHAAAVGVMDRTMEIYPYLHPTINGIILWDVPGMNTIYFQRKTYLDFIKFGRYDAFVIVCTDRLTADDIWLAKETQRYPKRPYYFVRSKIDQDIADDERDGDGDEEKVLQRIRQNIHKDLVKGHLPDENVFLVSSIHRLQPKWDFPKLKEKLTYETRTSMVLAMVSCTKDIISVKVEKLRERILNVALQAASVEDQYEEIIYNELTRYTKSLGIADMHMAKWGVDPEKLDSEVQRIIRNLNRPLTSLSFSERVASVLHRLIDKNSSKPWRFEIKSRAAVSALEEALVIFEKLAMGVVEEGEQSLKEQASREFRTARVPRTQPDGLDSTITEEVDRPPGPVGSTEAPDVASDTNSCSAQVPNTDRQLSTAGTEGTEAELTAVPEMDRVEECIKNLNIGDFFREVITEHFKDKGVFGLDKVLEAQLMEYMKCKVNIAVVGRSGTGKSSLINSLRNLPAKDDRAAAVGTTETTMAIFPYLHPTIKGIILWDVPGVNTSNFPRVTYLDDIEFGKYDAFVIVCTDRVTTDDIWLATETQKYPKRPYYFVRSKIDQDIANDERDGDGDEVKVVERIRESIRKDLVKGHLPDENVFLVSSILKLQPKWDFPRLILKLTYETPAKNRTSMVLAMVSCTKDLISLKVEKLRERILTVALQTASAEDQYDKVIFKELTRYTESLGITDIDLEKWGVDPKKLDPDLQRIKNNLDHFLRFLSVEEHVTKFLIGGVNYILEFFNMSMIIMEGYEQHQKEQRLLAKDRAEQSAFEVKRQAAVGALEEALVNCEKFALGVLEKRKTVAANLPLS